MLGGGIREENSGELFDGELIEGFIDVESVDDPIAPGPIGSGLILLET